MKPPFSARELAWELWDLTLPADLDQRLLELAQRLLEANQRLNLTSITDPAEIWERHFLDSLSVVRLAVGLGAGASVADVGSGAGFPGLVLALARPDLQVTLIEATARKVEFLRSVADTLHLHNVRAVAGRAEELARQPEYRARFEAAVARAVSSIASLVELLAPLVMVSGELWLMKTEAAAHVELGQAGPALQALACELIRIHSTAAGRWLSGRCIVVLRKQGETQSRFPRRVGMAQKRPLTSSRVEGPLLQSQEP